MMGVIIVFADGFVTPTHFLLLKVLGESQSAHYLGEVITLLVFADVPCPSLFADWIEQLAAEQITGGCGGGNYCPLSNNTRGQMAVFITKTFNLQ